MKWNPNVTAATKQGRDRRKRVRLIAAPHRRSHVMRTETGATM